MCTYNNLPPTPIAYKPPKYLSLLSPFEYNAYTYRVIVVAINKEIRPLLDKKKMIRLIDILFQYIFIYIANFKVTYILYSI